MFGSVDWRRELCAGDDYEGFQKIVYRGTLGKFLFTLFCHIIKNSYHLKWRNLLAADQWRLKWIFFFPLLAQQHFHWLFFEMNNFGLGFLTSWCISRKILTYADVTSHLSFKYISQMLPFWHLYILWLWIFSLVDWSISASHT